MKETCSRCHWKFTGLRVSKFIWCKVHRSFVCWRCWEDKCGKEHGLEWKNRDWHPMNSTFFWSWLIILFSLYIIVLANDIHQRDKWSELETTPIAGLEDGELVRLDGWMNASTGTVTVGGRKSPGRVWIWDQDDWFSFSDGTGTVNVTVKGYYMLEEGPTKVTLANGEKGWVYVGEDEAVIIGKVEVMENGTTVHVLWLGPDDSELPPSQNIYIGMGVFLSLNTLILLRLFIRTRKMNRTHQQKLGPVTPIPVSDGDRMQDPSLDWKNNPGPVGGLVLIPMLMFLGFMLVFVSQAHDQFHSFDQYLAMAGVAGIMGIPLTVHLPLAMISIYFSNSYPEEIALTEEGLHVFFKHPGDRFLEDDFISWKELRVKSTTHHWKGKEKIVVRDIFKKGPDGEKSILPRFSVGNLTLIRIAWEKWQKEHQDLTREEQACEEEAKA